MRDEEARANTPEQDRMVQELLQSDRWREHVESICKHAIHLCRLESHELLHHDGLAWQLSVALTSSVLANVLLGCRAVPDRVINEQSTMICKMLLHAAEHRHDAERTIDSGEPYTIDSETLSRAMN